MNRLVLRGIGGIAQGLSTGAQRFLDGVINSKPRRTFNKADIRRNAWVRFASVNYKVLSDLVEGVNKVLNFTNPLKKIHHHRASITPVQYLSCFPFVCCLYHR